MRDSREFFSELTQIHGSKMMRTLIELRKLRDNILVLLRIKSVLATLANHCCAMLITNAHAHAASIYISAQRRRYFIIQLPRMLRTFRRMVK